MQLRAIVPLSCLSLLALAACAGHETVKSSYVGTASMSRDQVRELLRQNGYTDVTGLHENGRDWVGAAKLKGQSVSFDIGSNGTIHTR